MNIYPSLSKLELIAGVLAHTEDPATLPKEGMYFVLNEVIEEIKAALASCEEANYKPANHAA